MNNYLFMLIASLSLWLFSCGNNYHHIVHSATPVDQVPQIKPDFTDLVIPQNIAPLNFTINQTGTRYLVKISANGKKPIIITSKAASIRIPVASWKSILAACAGDELSYEVFINQHGWKRYKPFKNRVAHVPIDRCLVYRSMPVIYNHYRDIRIMQHDLETNRRSQVFAFPPHTPGCVNCHTFQRNNPDSFSLQFRHTAYGNATVFSAGYPAKKVPVKFGYGSWHPSGTFVTYSINTVRQCFHSYRQEIRDHFDLSSHIVTYHVHDQKVALVPWSGDSASMESWPCWSPDGRYLYYVSSPVLWQNATVFPPTELEQVRYSLMRAGYDSRTGSWKTPDTLLSSKTLGQSITMPRCSPDGKFLVFCMHDWGTSPHLRQNSDLWLMDLASGTIKKGALNSEFAESWHSFSSNSRWIAFSSKRMGGILTRIFIAYLDTNGTTSKPFVIPQTDPDFYDSHSNVCNTPELLLAMVKVRQQTLLRAVRSHTDKQPSGPLPYQAPERNGNQGIE